jgi:hypothetical protein
MADDPRPWYLRLCFDLTVIVSFQIDDSTREGISLSLLQPVLGGLVVGAAQSFGIAKDCIGQRCLGMTTLAYVHSRALCSIEEIITYRVDWRCL